MIRFLPDTWLEALLRYFAMAAPNASVYIEIPAPDFRFAALALLLAVALFRPRGLMRAKPVAALSALILIATGPWLVSSGNGRYWIPMLLCVGPVVVGLIWLLPVTRAFRVFLAGGLLAAQAFVVQQNPPWESWGMADWDEPPYYQIALPPAKQGDVPVTYVTASSNSFSLVAPQFPPDTRWINITSPPVGARERKARQLFLASAKKLELLAPTIAGEMTPEGQPSAGYRRAMNMLMASSRLSIDPAKPCTLLRSTGLMTMATKKRVMSEPDMSQIGFWTCPLRLSDADSPPVRQALPARTEAAFAAVERMCPRFFPRGAASVPIPGGALRQYSDSDMTLYVMDDGEVRYRYWRALNATLIGSADDVLNGKAALDCNALHGRSGLPWDREI